MTNQPDLPARSAAELAEQLGDDLLAADEIPAEHFALVEAVRDLVAAAVATDISASERSAVARMIAHMTERLQRETRDPVILLARHADGRLENLTQAGAGRLNPQAPRLIFHDLPSGPVTRHDPEPVEVRATCMPSAAHLGPPNKLHGGVVAALLDEALGVAATAAGATGLTAGIDVRYRAATPADTELVVHARFTHRDGRKSFATGEVVANGTVTAEATAVFIFPIS